MAPNYNKAVEDQRKVWLTGKTRSKEWRQKQLEQLVKLLEEQEQAFCDAVYKDLHKCKTEALMMEIKLARNEAVSALNELDHWMKPKQVKKNLTTLMDDCYIHHEPFGVVLIMGAWNYPIQLIFHAVVGAIAAGNCVFIKPSEISENTANLIEKVIPQYLDNECFQVVNGGIPETTALLEERFDFILYTGNSTVAKIIMTAAAKHLTPVSLELGGKSPCYVDENCDINVASRRIVWGKFVNAGQTCIAPDYILCHKSVKDKLLIKIKENIAKFYGTDPQKSEDFGRIVSSRHVLRLKNLLKDADIVVGGTINEADKYFAPTVLDNVKPTDPVMQEEIFGPIMPILTVSGSEEAIEFINAREKPLALYIFTHDTKLSKHIISRTSSGGTCVNDCIMHAGLETLPFGGVGNSGMGGYHGFFTFEMFSHKRSVMIKKQSMEKLNDLRYPPSTQKKADWLNWLMKKDRKRSLSIFYPIALFLGVLAFIVRMISPNNSLESK